MKKTISTIIAAFVVIAGTNSCQKGTSNKQEAPIATEPVRNGNAPIKQQC